MGETQNRRRRVRVGRMVRAPLHAAARMSTQGDNLCRTMLPVTKDFPRRRRWVSDRPPAPDEVPDRYVDERPAGPEQSAWERTQ